MLYIVYCESAHYYGYGQYFVAEANSRMEAECAIQPAAEAFFREENGDRLVEEGHDPDSLIYSTMVTTEEFNEDHECWPFYQKADQAEFYIKVNFQ